MFKIFLPMYISFIFPRVFGGMFDQNSVPVKFQRFYYSEWQQENQIDYRHREQSPTGIVCSVSFVPEMI